MKWFKHYTNAHKGNVLQELYLKFGVNQGHGLYFRLIEYLGDKWDGHSEPKFKVLEKELRKFLGLSRKSLKTFAETFEKSPENSFTVSEEFCEIFLPKLLNIRHKDALPSGQRRADGGPIPPPREEEEQKREENKNNSSLAKFKNWEELLAALPLVTLDTWYTKHGKEFTDNKIASTFAYHAAKPESASWNVLAWVSRIGTAIERQIKFDAESKARQQVQPSDYFCGLAD